MWAKRQGKAIPPQPAPPGPDNRNVAILNAATPTVIAYNKLYPVTIIRVAGIKTSSDPIGISATYGALPFTHVATVEDGVGPFCSFLYLDNAATGSQNIMVSVTGAAETVAVRTGPLAAMSSIGQIQSAQANSGLVDITLTGLSGDGQISQQCVFADPAAFGVTQYYDGIEQYSSVIFDDSVNLLTNGDFTSDAGWSGMNWAIASGKANCTATGGRILQQTVALSAGQYHARLTVDSIPAGGWFQLFVLRGGWQAVSASITATGTYDFIVSIASPATTFGIQGSNMLAGGVIDNLSLAVIEDGAAVWFGTQPTVGTAISITLEPDNYNDAPDGCGLAVEIIGAVLP